LVKSKGSRELVRESPVGFQQKQAETNNAKGALNFLFTFWFKPKSNIGLADKPSKAIKKIIRTG